MSKNQPRIGGKGKNDGTRVYRTLKTFAKKLSNKQQPVDFVAAAAAAFLQNKSCTHIHAHTFILTKMEERMKEKQKTKDRNITTRFDENSNETRLFQLIL